MEIAENKREDALRALDCVSFAVRERTILALLIALVAGGALIGAGCGDDASGGDGPRVAFVGGNPGHPYWAAVQAGAKAAEAGSRDVDVQVTATNSDSSAEPLFAKIEDALATSPDALAVVPVFPDEVKAPLERAIADGIPVVTIDTPIVGLEGSTYVGTDNVEVGRIAAKYLVDQELGAGDTAAIQHCIPGITSSDERVQGFEEGLEGTGIEVVATLDAKCELEKGRSTMEDILTAHPDVDAIYSVSDDQTLGTTQALDATDRPLIVSVYSQADAVQAVIDGRIDAIIAQFPEEMGEKGVEAAIAAARGEELGENIYMTMEVITKENASDFLE